MGNRYYIWGDDAIWKLPIKLLQSNMDPRELLTHGKMLKSVPKGVYETESGRYDSCAPGVYITHYDHIEEMIEYWRN